MVSIKNGMQNKNTISSFLLIHYSFLYILSFKHLYTTDVVKKIKNRNYTIICFYRNRHWIILYTLIKLLVKTRSV